MAFKFSELRGLLKDTSIQTVKMSDPAYKIQMKNLSQERIGGSSWNTSISFKNINALKNTNNLHKIVFVAPLTIELYLHLNMKSYMSHEFIIFKNGFLPIFNKIREGLSRLYPSNNNILKYFVDNNRDIQFKNSYLIGYRYQNLMLQDIVFQKYYNGRWNDMNSGIKLKANDVFVYNYETIDSDQMLRSGVLFKTKPLYANTYGWYLRIWLAFKANDNFNEDYNSVYVYHEISNPNQEYSKERYEVTDNSNYERQGNKIISIDNFGLSDWGHEHTFV